jgi:chromosome segregation ATPase
VQRSRTMEIFKLDKAIENEKLDLEMAMVQLNKAKEHLSISLKRRKDLAKEMNDHQYMDTTIEDLMPSSSSSEADEANKAIKELLQKNGSLQEEIRMLRREHESQSIRLCETMDQRNRMQQEIERRDSETQNQSPSSLYPRPVLPF